MTLQRSMPPHRREGVAPPALGLQPLLGWTCQSHPTPHIGLENHPCCAFPRQDGKEEPQSRRLLLRIVFGIYLAKLAINLTCLGFDLSHSVETNNNLASIACHLVGRDEDFFYDAHGVLRTANALFMFGLVSARFFVAFSTETAARVV